MKYAFYIAFCGLLGCAIGAVICRHVLLERELRGLRLDLSMHAQAISELQSRLLPKTDFRPKPDVLAALP